VRLMTVVTLALALTLAAEAYLAAGSPSAVSLNAAAWTLVGSPDLVLHPTNLTGMEGWAAQLPTSTGSYVASVVTQYTSPLSRVRTIVIGAQVTTLAGAPTFTALDSCSPASVRLTLARTFQDGSDGHTELQWWSYAGVWPLQAGGSVGMVVPLHPAHWINAEGLTGADVPIDFTQTLARPALIGLGFGGGCVPGQGITTAGGSAQFILTTFSINK